MTTHTQEQPSPTPTTLRARQSVVGIFRTHEEAEAAVKRLQSEGFDMQALSVVGRGYHSEEHPIGFYNTGDRMKHWGKFGAFWGSIWGLLFGSAFFWLPGLGPVLVGGFLVSTLVGALEGAVVVGGLSALGAALFSLGLPRDSIVRYETALKADKYLVIAHCPAEQAEDARRSLEASRPESLDLHRG
jgi:hypothetical protein